jgi:hypothetical protein
MEQHGGRHTTIDIKHKEILEIKTEINADRLFSNIPIVRNREPKIKELYKNKQAKLWKRNRYQQGPSLGTHGIPIEHACNNPDAMNGLSVCFVSSRKDNVPTSRSKCKKRQSHSSRMQCSRFMIVMYVKMTDVRWPFRFPNMEINQNSFS